MTSKNAQPTAGELELLAILWKLGPASVREVHAELSRTRKVGYTTVLKQLQLMASKQLVVRDESKRSHIYRARSNQKKTQKTLVRDLVDKAFAGSTSQLVLSALSARKASSAEIKQIRDLLDRQEQEGQ